MMDPTGESSGNAFGIFDLDSSAIDLSDLHARVLRHSGRIELQRCGGSCVLISKDELDGLEKALEILSNTDTMRAMRAELAMVASLTRSATPPPPPMPARRLQTESP
jgi:hypothetical protein